MIVDLETFNRMESIIEDNGLAKFMEEAKEDETLSVHEAKKHYTSLKNCQVVTLNSCSRLLQTY